MSYAWYFHEGNVWIHRNHGKKLIFNEIYHVQHNQIIRTRIRTYNQLLKRISHTSLLTNKAKSILIKGFSKNIRQLKADIDKFKTNIPFLNMISNEIVFNLNLFAPRVLDRVFSRIYGTCIVIFYWDEIIMKIKIFQWLFQPQYLCITISDGNLLGFRGWQSCRVLFLIKPRD